MNTGLSDTQLAAFRRDGYLVIEDFIPAEVMAALRQRALELVAEFDPREAVSVFTTDRERRVSDRYFLESGDKIRFFFEEQAFLPDGTLCREKALCINKIGHALHDRDVLFSQFSRQPALREICRSLGYRCPLLAQSMYIFKQPHIGGEVSCHQDATFLFTEPPSVTGFWFALEPATPENGCLWALPGGHRLPLKSRFVRTPAGETRFIELDREPLPADGLIPLPVPAGALILLHGNLPHYSKPNLSPRSRHAYTLHVIEGEFPYPADNWLQRPANNPFQGFDDR